ncbi:MAG: hypothetical protein N2B00_11670, partial [Vibrio fluvialis]
MSLWKKFLAFNCLIWCNWTLPNNDGMWRGCMPVLPWCNCNKSRFFMANSTPNFLQFFEQLQQLAAKQRCRFGIRLQGGADWQQALVQQVLNQQNAHATVFQLGGDPNSGVT